MKVLVVNKESPQRAALDNFIARHHLLFLSPDWSRIYPEANYRQAAILNANEEIIGCFHFYEYRRAFFRFRITPPYSPNISLFYLNPSVSPVGRQTFDKELMSRLCDFLLSDGGDLVDLQFPLSVKDLQPMIWQGMEVKTRYTYLLDLGQSEQALREKLSPEKRKSLNKAEKDQIQVKESSDYSEVLELVSASLERNQVNKNSSVLRAILLNYADKQRVISFIATLGGKAIGASFCLIDGDTAIYLFGGFDGENKHHGAGVKCMWESIMRAKARGLKTFDFEGSMVPGIERYFREFGGTLTPYFAIAKTSTRFKFLKMILRRGMK